MLFRCLFDDYLIIIVIIQELFSLLALRLISLLQITLMRMLMCKHPYHEDAYL